MNSILRRYSFQAVALAAALLAGCIEMKEPLSDPMASQADPALCGVWRQSDKDGPTNNYYFIGQPKPEEGCPSGVMNVVESGYEESERKASSSEFSGFITKVDTVTYFNLFPSTVQTRQNWDAWKQDPNHKVFLVRYEIKDDELTVNAGDEDAYKQLRDEKHLDDPAAMLAYLKTDGADKLFPAAKRIVLHRVH
jgi:hypothetical protein